MKNLITMVTIQTLLRNMVAILTTLLAIRITTLTILTGAPKNLGVDTFPDPVGYFEAA